MDDIVWHEFLAEVNIIEGVGGTDRALDKIFSTFDDLFRAGNFEKCDEILSNINPDNFNTSVNIGFLAASNVAKKELKARPKLFQKIRAKYPEFVEGLE